MYKTSLQFFYLWICLSVKYLPNRSIWICCYYEICLISFWVSVYFMSSLWSKFLHEVFTRCLSYSSTYDYSDSGHLAIKRYVLGCRVLFTCGKSALLILLLSFAFSQKTFLQLSQVTYTVNWHRSLAFDRVIGNWR